MTGLPCRVHDVGVTPGVVGSDEYNAQENSGDIAQAISSE
jgi:hypothetical protein